MNPPARIQLTKLKEGRFANTAPAPGARVPRPMSAPLTAAGLHQQAADLQASADQLRATALSLEDAAARLGFAQFTWDRTDPDGASRPLLPIKYPDLWGQYQMMLRLSWPNKDVDLREDLASMQTLSPGMQHSVKMMLAFFSQIDRIVMANLGTNFGHDARNCPEAVAVMVQQAAQEVVHNESYELQIRAVVPDRREQEDLLRSATRLPVVAAMYSWTHQWLDRQRPLGWRLAAFALVEGVMFWGPFAVFEYLRTRGALPGITHANTLIARDEDTHAANSAMLFGHLEPREAPPAGELQAMVEGLVAVLDDFNAFERQLDTLSDARR